MTMRLAVLSFGLALTACQSAADQAGELRQAGDAKSALTLGAIQHSIHVGMASADVAEALGAPNMVSTDEQRREVWVYDRVATETAGSSSAGGVGIPLLAGIGGGGGARTESQRTLTVIVKFDDAGRVRDYAYRSSTF